jgi:GNAT superfamily N-acetyltransferase
MSETIQCAALSVEELHSDTRWWEIYNVSFPPDERDPPEVIWKSLRMGVRATLGGQTAGMATLHLLHNPPTAFLVYLAVDPARKGERIGSRLFEESWRLPAGGRGPAPGWNDLGSRFTRALPIGRRTPHAGKAYPVLPVTRGHRAAP